MELSLKDFFLFDLAGGSLKDHLKILVLFCPGQNWYSAQSLYGDVCWNFCRQIFESPMFKVMNNSWEKQSNQKTWEEILGEKIT